MKRISICFVLALSLSLFFAANAVAGELEDQLFKAINDSDVEGVRSLISRGADVNAIDQYGYSPYDLAYENASIACSVGSASACSNGELILEMLEAAGAQGVLSE